jgi:hypothetical protein
MVEFSLGYAGRRLAASVAGLRAPLAATGLQSQRL